SAVASLAATRFRMSRTPSMAAASMVAVPEYSRPALRHASRSCAVGAYAQAEDLLLVRLLHARSLGGHHQTDDTAIVDHTIDDIIGANGLVVRRIEWMIVDLHDAFDLVTQVVERGANLWPVYRAGLPDCSRQQIERIIALRRRRRRIHARDLVSGVERLDERGPFRRIALFDERLRHNGAVTV